MNNDARTTGPDGIRSPLQERSRQSFERVLDAAMDLLMEVGYEGLTVAGVSARAGASTGSIYGRVRGKDDLLRAVQERILERTEAGQAAMLADLQAEHLPLSRLVPRAVDALAEFMRSHADLLRPLMTRAVTDDKVAGRGKASHAKLQDGWTAVILTRAPEVQSDLPERAVLSCFRIVYASLARYLGLGSSPESAGEGDWADLKVDLGRMALAYLSWPGPESAGGASPLS